MRAIICLFGMMVCTLFSCENKNGERNSNALEFSQLDEGSNTTGTRSGNSSLPRDSGTDTDLNPPLPDTAINGSATHTY